MAMPDFLVIGVAKCGTTSLHACLSQDPQIFMSSRKEPHLFEFGEPDQMPLEMPAPPKAIRTLAAMKPCLQW